MKFQRIVFLILLLAAAAQIWHFYPQMPEKMASHFNGRGDADAWMPRENFVTVYLFVLGLIAILFNVLPAMMRILPSSMVNLPHREYWLSPEHRGEAERILAFYLYGSGNATIALLLCVFHLVFRANLASDVRLGGGMLLLLVVFVLFMVGWSVPFLRAFRLPPGAERSQRGGAKGHIDVSR